MEGGNEESVSIRILFEDLVKFISDFPFYVYLFFSTVFESLVANFKPNSSKSLERETILVTGAATGLGRAIVLKIAKRFKPILVLWDINKDELQKTAEECSKLGAKIHCYVVDLSDHQAIIQTAQKVREDVGSVTILYNNAGIVSVSPFYESNVTMDEKVLKVNLLSYMWTIREFLPDMIERGRGHLVSTCSGIAFLRFRNIASYTASKYGLKGFIDSLKHEMRLHPKKPDIKISTVYPSWIKTQMTSGFSWEPRYRSGLLLQMDSEYVAEKVVDGIINEVEEMIIPQFLRLFVIAYWILPTKFFDRMEQFLYKDIKVIDTTCTATLGSKVEHDIDISQENTPLITGNRN